MGYHAYLDNKVIDCGNRQPQTGYKLMPLEADERVWFLKDETLIMEDNNW